MLHSFLRYILSFLLVVPFLAEAQYRFQFDQSIAVSANDQQLKMPWAGGLNSAQINSIDLNGDGKEDLAIYDKTSGAIVTFIWKDNAFHFEPGYAYLFPSDVAHFMILRDFNGNGRKDLFTATQLGIRVYENIGSQSPAWELKAPFIETTGSSGNVVNLQVSQDDLPAIVDLDGDGDLDILAFTFTGFDSFVRYYKNVSMEKYGHANALEYELVSTRWGDFQECDCGDFAFGEEDCDLSLLKSVKQEMEIMHNMHPGGKSILVMDINGDGIKDLFTSHEECDELYVLQNTGENNENAIIRNLQTGFPVAKPANFPFLPTPYYEDVDGDGIKDLIVSPNMGRNLADQIDFANSLWFYKNIGSNAAPDFSFQTESFLQQHMVDIGENAYPLLYDLDNDGDLDLLVSGNKLGSNGQMEGSVYYFENVGSANNPIFSLQHDDLWQLKDNGLTHIQIQLSDLNANGRTDLLLTASQQGTYRSFFIFNTSGDLRDFRFSQAVQLSGIPTLFGYQVLAYDITQNGQKELFFARPSGGLDIYENTASAASPNFQRSTHNYLGISDDFFRSNLRIAIADLNNNGNPDLISADRSGEVLVYPNFRNFDPNTNEPQSNILYERISDRFTTTRLGTGINITLGTITDDSFPAMILGSRLGGLHLLRNTEELPIPENRRVVKLYPNPVTQKTVSIQSEFRARMDIMTLDGKLIFENLAVESEIVNNFDLSDFSPGIYMARFRLANGRKEFIRFIIP